MDQLQKNELTPKEIRQIKRYCMMPPLAVPAVIGALIMPFVCIILIMINDIALNAQADHTMEEISVAVGISVVWLSIYAYCFLGPRYGIKRKKWKTILQKLDAVQSPVISDGAIITSVGLSNVGRLMQNSDSQIVSDAGTAAQIAGTAAAMAAVGKQMAQIEDHALTVARAWGIQVPSNRKYIWMLLLLPSLIMTLLFIPYFRESVADNNKMKETVSLRMEQMEAALQSDDMVIEKDDPYHNKMSTCEIRFYVKDDPTERYLVVSFEENGVVEEMTWHMEEDHTMSREENLNRFMEFIDTTGEKALATAIPLWQETLAGGVSVPDSVLTEYLQAPEQKDVSAHVKLEKTDYFLSRHVMQDSTLSNSLFYSVQRALGE